MYINVNLERWTETEAKEFGNAVASFEYRHPVVTFSLRAAGYERNYKALNCLPAIISKTEGYYDYSIDLKKFANSFQEEVGDILVLSMDQDIAIEFRKLLSQVL